MERESNMQRPNVCVFVSTVICLGTDYLKVIKIPLASVACMHK